MNLLPYINSKPDDPPKQGGIPKRYLDQLEPMDSGPLGDSTTLAFVYHVRIHQLIAAERLYVSLNKVYDILDEYYKSPYWT